MTPRLGIVLVPFLVVACTATPAPSGRRAPTIDTIAGKLPATGDADVLVHFDDARAATDAITAVHAAGGRADRLAGTERLVRIRTRATTLATLPLPPGTLATRNTPVRLVRPSSPPPPETGGPGGGPPSPSATDEANAFLTARSITGVSALTARIPAADGRGLKVAVFDEGIDFGIQGLSTPTPGAPASAQKLAGFFDLTGFGQVTATPLPQAAALRDVTIAGKTLHFADDLHPALLQATGTLDETAIAKASLMAEVDLNANAKSTDVFPFAVGVNSKGQQALWIDANGDGLFANEALEELTDFNTTFKHVDLRPDVAGGARSLAVTIRSATDVQFHAVVGGHGTSCATIIAGDGYANGLLSGMAPKAQLVAYVLDAAGQDLYTMDQLVAMFAHAKGQRVDAISISWGFATADVESARFLADFIDKEITSAGIVVGIAAGNEGPGVGSASPDDYIPHDGFALGAYVSEAQARNVYGWNGNFGSGMVEYTSVGPTAGGRQSPDVVSPIVTLVRGAREPKPASFYGFSGTSSATPAFIGSATALVGALKASGIGAIDARLLKLAITATAHPIPNEPAIRQGAGVVDVDAAFDRYVALAREAAAVKADPTHRAPFAYGLRARSTLDGAASPSEGIFLRAPRASADVDVVVRPDSLAATDPQTFVTVLSVVHDADWLRTPSVVTVQTNGAHLSVAFDLTKIATPGTYSDVLRLVRPSDGTPLLSIPVVVAVPARPGADGAFGAIDATMGAFDVWHLPIAIDAPTAVRFDGLVENVGHGDKQWIGLFVHDASGHPILTKWFPSDRPATTMSTVTPVLPPGDYEITAARSFDSPSVVGDVRVRGALALPAATAVAAEAAAGHVRVAVRGGAAVDFKGATLTIDGDRRSTRLTRDASAARPAFVGALDFGRAVKTVKLAVTQTPIDRAVDRFLHVEATLEDDDGATLDRQWLDVTDPGAPPSDATLAKAVTRARVVAYPNIADWAHLPTATLDLGAVVPIDPPLVAKLAEADRSLAPGALITLDFGLENGAALPASATGHVDLTGKDGVVATFDVGY